MTSRILRSAKQTVADGMRFYESQDAGLGPYFFSSIMSDLRSLKIYGGTHQKFNDSYYRMVCTKFPYSIYYRLESLEISVYAVLDDRRDPESTEDLLGRLRA
ncbi:MAG: type II toxin-antitoxin system RelE/ParE family toxin [Pyrinomonadaceae bacterium]